MFLGTEQKMEVVTETSLALTLNPEFTAYALSDERATVLVSLKGLPLGESQQRSSRADVDLVAVIDRCVQEE